MWRLSFTTLELISNPVFNLVHFCQNEKKTNVVRVYKNGGKQSLKGYCPYHSPYLWKNI